MKCCQLNKQNNKNLIVFFAGWSFDEKPFGKLVCGGFDILFIYDYNELNLPKDLENLQNYEHKYLLAWSMGVFVAYEFRKLFEDFDYKIAINGTITPVDNEFGITVKMFELTLKHVAIGLAGKFYQNVFKNSEEFEIYSKTSVQRTIENRVSELENLYNAGKYTPLTLEEYIEKACYIISHLRKDIVIHRVSGDAPKDILIAPEWNAHKKWIMNGIDKKLKEEDLWQGKANRNS